MPEMIRTGDVHIMGHTLSFQPPFPMINFVVLVWGFAWNIWMLPLTLWRRWDDNRRAAAIRQQRSLD